MSGTERRKVVRVGFERGIPAFLMAIDGTWRRGCTMADVSEAGAKLIVSGSIEGLNLREFFLVLSSTGLAYRRCELSWINGDQIGARFVQAERQEIAHWRRRWRGDNSCRSGQSKKPRSSFSICTHCNKQKAPREGRLPHSIFDRSDQTKARTDPLSTVRDETQATKAEDHHRPGGGLGDRRRDGLGASKGAERENERRRIEVAVVEKEIVVRFGREDSTTAEGH